MRERVAQITNLNLPLLADVELLGDERQTLSGRDGTQYREAITVVAHHAGSLAIAPATLQAIDARDGKPKQWYTNGLTLYVGGVSALDTARERRAFLEPGDRRAACALLGAAAPHSSCC